ncbi:MAG: hypothetical protein AABW89_00880 [Nanoarchaeota archaeon]
MSKEEINKKMSKLEKWGLGICISLLAWIVTGPVANTLTSALRDVHYRSQADK